MNGLSVDIALHQANVEMNFITPMIWFYFLPSLEVLEFSGIFFSIGKFNVFGFD